jgi:periplasmic mercuric ion binding protein
MKPLFFLFALLFTTLTSGAQTKSITTVTLSVKGNCEECKEHIENAADIKGVKICSWNPDTKIATITYNPDKVSLIQISEAIAATGYDAGDVKGNEVAYNKLPTCCKYKNGKCEELKK